MAYLCAGTERITLHDIEVPVALSPAAARAENSYKAHG